MLGACGSVGLEQGHPCLQVAKIVFSKALGGCEITPQALGGCEITPEALGGAK